jgi:hypothetical protein
VKVVNNKDKYYRCHLLGKVVGEDKDKYLIDYLDPDSNSQWIPKEDVEHFEVEE